MTLAHRLLAARLRLFARHVGASKRPILLGPFHSEVGLEVLYWLPFLHRLRATYGWDKSRLVALSRGGASVWYDVAGQADLYNFLPIETVRLHMWHRQERRKSIKQFDCEPWERHVTQLAASSLGLTHPIMVHPSWMYRLLAPMWRDEMSMQTLATWIDPKPFPKIPLPDGLTLPERFVVCRIYARATMEGHDGVLLYLKQLVAKLAKKQPVIFLSSDDRYDDHADLLRPSGSNQADLGSFLLPTTNLEVQSAVIQRASFALMTYGGLSQLAMRLGVPTVGLYTTWHGTALAHLDLTQRLAVTTKVPFHLVHAQSAERLETLL